MNNTLKKTEIDKIKYNLKIISIGSILFTIFFGIFFHKYAVKHEHQVLSILIVTIIPAIAMIYNLYYNTEIYKDSHNRKHELNETNMEMRAESKFYEIIAFLLFGLGLIYAEFKKYKYLSIVLPYLLFALLFGTIFTSWLKQFVFDYNNLERLLKIDVLIFCSTALSVGLLTAGLIVPIVYHSTKRGIAG